MPDYKCNLQENSWDLAHAFLESQDRRKAPNNRVGDKHFLDIAYEGACKLEEQGLHGGKRG